MKQTIILLGHRGMLGSQVDKYFNSRGYKLVTTEERFTKDNFNSWKKTIEAYPQAIIINCIGSIKQKTSDPDELLWGNTVLPLEICNSMSDHNFLIHPSTDCVFSGRNIEPYTLSDRSDAEDIYGWSKRLGEVALMGKKNTLVVRVSIIGHETSSNKSGLLEWFLNNPEGAKLKGFTNHFWNGITTLEWCKQVEKLLPKLNDYAGEIIQLGTRERYSKFDMLQMFKRIYNKDFDVEPYATPEIMQRCLVPSIESINLEEQLLELEQSNKK